MDYLQYRNNPFSFWNIKKSFKPCYKWITFNTEIWLNNKDGFNIVLNLVINGLPSIQFLGGFIMKSLNVIF